MTAPVSYALGTPRTATQRGGDCRARDLRLGRNVLGGHRFAVTSDCRISNGLVQATLGASGIAGALTIAAYRGEVTIEDYYADIYDDVYAGSTSVPDWHGMGVVTLDSPDVTALLTAVVVHHRSPESITLRLVVPAMADAYVILRRGERMLRIQHGEPRAGLVDIDRRIRWTDTLNPVGTAYPGRVQEDAPAVEGFPRVIGCRGAVDTYPSLFSLVAPSVRSATFLAGVATSRVKDRPADYLAHLGTEFRLPPAIDIHEAA